MKDKKHIDRLFQEKFKDFEAAPSNQVWKNIEMELKPNKKKRAALFWWRLGGLAAVLTIAFLAGNWFFKTQNQLSNSSPSQVEISEPKLRDEPEQNLLTSEDKEVEFSNTTTPLDIQKNASEEKIIKKEKRSNWHEQKFVKFKQKKYLTQSAFSAAQPKNNKQIGHKDDNQRQLKVSPKMQVKNNAIATINSNVNDFNSNNNNTSKKQEPKEILNFVESSAFNPLEKGIEKANALTEKAKEQKDTPNKTEDLVAQNRWSVTPQMSPIYFGNLNAKGNPIDARFASNENDGAISMNYGIQFGYQISTNFKIRSGINRIVVGNKTKEIGFTASAENVTTLRNLNITPTAMNLKVVPNPEQMKGVQGFSNYIAGNIQQQMGFIEIPLELEYTLLQRKINIHLIGGASTLLLNKNEVAINSELGNVNLGEANNLNNVSFTTNLGVGLGYNFSEKIRFQLEPTFKYQLNTYTGNTAGYSPFLFGLYTGINWKF
ncbi:PorT family protein [Mesonia sp. HuA40]|uniref:PorT family protein n=1 Tax=Mesonia sp. HuA40 TaxID=2602761 RepID=UPI0011C71C0E|nr:PorT family protein [Mesonia sp. HuA40]TXK72677.1 PorT family protein [Mesonia sp. HuA40]